MRLQHVEAGGSVGNEGKKLLAKRDDRQIEIVEGQYSNGGLVHVPHAIPAHFVLDSKAAPFLLQFFLRPGNVLPRAVHLLKRPAALAARKSQALSEIFFVHVKLSLYSRNPS